MIVKLHASAGSGKTYRLTRRFLHLLMGSGAPEPACGNAPGGAYGPEAILAITFTNKAAAEMQSRVLRALKTLALGLPDPDFTSPPERARAGALLESALRHFQTLNIRTIDSLLNQLARLFALELGLPPGFTTSLDEGTVFEDLHDAVMARMDDPEVEALVARMTDALGVVEDGGGFWLGPRVEKRLRAVFADMLSGQSPPPCDAGTLHREAEQLRQALSLSAGALERALETAGARPVANFAAYLATAGGLASLRDLPDSAYLSKHCVEDCLLKDSKHLATPGLQELYEALARAHRTAKGQGALLAKALAWHPFLECGRLLLDAYEAYRRDNSLALLSQLPGSVAGLLREAGGVPEAYCRLGSRLHHLLIDEFQDTSASQWDVLSQLAQECLSKGGSLFYVGDVKQAIYGWRGGEAALFERAARQPELANICRPVSEALDTNWRSDPEIVRFNNAVFSSLAAPETSRMVAAALLQDAPEPVREDLAGSLAACFAQASQQVPAASEGDGGLVSLARLPGSTAGEHEEAVRDAVRTFFTQLGGRRPHADVAVLTRTNQEAATVAQWLVDLGIPVVTENSLRLAEHPMIRGAVSFLAFLDYPPDNMALWGFLSCHQLFGRSQRISRQVLSDWLAAQPKGRPLYRAFRRDFPEAWQRMVEPFLKGAGPASPYDLVQELLRACGAFEAYPHDEVFLRRFLELAHNAETQGHGSLSSFLEFWNDKGRGEKIPQPEEAPAVRVLTMHKAKGLQFPVVVVPFHAFPLRRREGLVTVECGGASFTAPLCKEAGEHYHRQAARDLQEQINLLYVAWTRPEQELHLFLPSDQKMVNRSPAAKAIEILLQAAGVSPNDAQVVFGRRPPSRASLVDGAAQGQPAAPDPGEPSPPEAPLSASPPLDWLPGLKIARRLPGDPAERLRVSERRRGVVLHKALERLEPGMDPLQAVMAAMASEGVRDDDMALELAESLEWLAGLDFFPLCQGLGLREAELMDEDGQVHRPDLLAFTPEATLVLDYKTGREDPAHHEQVARYLRLAAALPRAAGLPARGLLVYLDLKAVREVSPGEPL